MQAARKSACAQASNLFRAVGVNAARARGYATEAGAAKTLLIVEHKAGKVNPATLNALSAAQSLGGEVVGLVAGDESGVDQVAASLKKLPLTRLIVQKASDKIGKGLAEPLAPLIAETVKNGGFSHIVAAHTALGKNVLPRVAGLLDVAQISDVQKIVSGDTFERPIYAGNAIATVRSKDQIKVLTIRSSAFDSATEADTEAKQEDGSAKEGEAPSEWVSEEITVSSRPDLGSASVVVSGGRGLKNKENFDNIMTPLADALGAAIGASRAAVDSGYADNSLQVGQTGKIVAPDLYVAVGISGAIQHLAGMREARTICAINKDPEAPIFQVADAGLQADLFDAVPELTKKLSK